MTDPCPTCGRVVVLENEPFARLWSSVAEVYRAALAEIAAGEQHGDPATFAQAALDLIGQPDDEDDGNA